MQASMAHSEENSPVKELNSQLQLDSIQQSHGTDIPAIRPSEERHGSYRAYESSYPSYKSD